jgi:spore coat protein JC
MGDPIADLHEDMAVEQKARPTYDYLIKLTDDVDLADGLKFLREREVVHFRLWRDPGLRPGLHGQQEGVLGKAIAKVKDGSGLRLSQGPPYLFNALSAASRAVLVDMQVPTGRPVLPIQLDLQAKQSIGV